jgi:hypothetical protein
MKNAKRPSGPGKPSAEQREAAEQREQQFELQSDSDDATGMAREARHAERDAHTRERRHGTVPGRK